MNAYDNEIAHVKTVGSSWQKVLPLGMERHLTKGTVIMRAGQIVDTLYYLTSGEVRMERSNLDGLQKTYWYIGPDCVFGETPLFHRMPTTLTAVCTKPTIVYLFSRDTLIHKILPNNPELFMEIVETLAHKVRVLTNQIATLSMDALNIRICKYLHNALERDEQGHLFVSLHISQQTLANVLGVHRVSCNRALRELEKKGIISECTNKKIYIRDETEFFRLTNSMPTDHLPQMFTT